jgi:hypothetical protein
MRYAVPVARYLLGTLLLLFGLNGFLGFIPPPPEPPLPSDGGVLMEALVGTPYLWALIKGVEVLVGVLLLANRFVPLALVLFAPGAVNILLYHLFLDPATVAVGLVVFVLEVGLLVAYRRQYAVLLRGRVAVPAVIATPEGRPVS